MNKPLPQMRRILLVTGMSGAGKTTALHQLEDMGWETVDNLPLSLIERLLDDPATLSDRSLAIGIDSRTRGFDAAAIVERIKQAESAHGVAVETLFLDCGDGELAQRFSETRRRHPLALDRPAEQGVAREREILVPLKRWAGHVIDTTGVSTHELRQEIHERFATGGDEEIAVTVASFGFARGILRNADLVFDMRFLRNPHWDEALRPLTGQDKAVAAYIAEDPAYDEATQRIEELVLMLLPRYRAEGKAYMTIAFGCTGGRHRSVHVAERMAQRLRDAGFSPTVAHRDLASRPVDGIERQAVGNMNDGG